VQVSQVRSDKVVAVRLSFYGVQLVRFLVRIVMAAVRGALKIWSFLGGNGTYLPGSRCSATARSDHVVHSLDSRARGSILRSMPVTPEELAQKAMELTAEGRAELADLLVESLGTAQLAGIDRAWLVEAKRRRDEIRSGRATTIPASEAIRQVRDALEQ